MKVHYAGRSEEGEEIFTECGGSRILSAKPTEPGKPAGLGRRLMQVTPLPDGRFEAEDLDGGGPLSAGGGPAQVATDEYRDGWERVFGGKSSGAAN